MIYNGFCEFCCVYLSNIWWKFTSVNWGPSIAILISLPIDVTNSRLKTILKWVWFQQKWVWSNKRVALFLKLFPPPPPRKKSYMKPCIIIIIIINNNNNNNTFHNRDWWKWIFQPGLVFVQLLPQRKQSSYNWGSHQLLISSWDS